VSSLEMCEAMAGKAMPGKPAEMAATEMAAATKTATSSTMATASSTMCERGGGRERQNAGQNQTDKRTLDCSHKLPFFPTSSRLSPCSDNWIF
jgi:hypothetical protein